MGCIVTSTNQGSSMAIKDKKQQISTGQKKI